MIQEKYQSNFYLEHESIEKIGKMFRIINTDRIVFLIRASTFYYLIFQTNF